MALNAAPQTLSEELRALPAGSLYVTPTGRGWDESFKVHVRGLQVQASVTEFAPTVWSVLVFDHLEQSEVATATIQGVQHKAAQQAIGLLSGVALTKGVEPKFPTAQDLRIQLA